MAEATERKKIRASSRAAPVPSTPGKKSLAEPVLRETPNGVKVMFGSKIKDTIILRNYAFVKTLPKSIKFTDHLAKLQLLPRQSHPKNIAWGIWGATAINAVDIKAAEHGLKNGLIVLHLEMTYKVPNFKWTTETQDPLGPEGVHCIHVPRIKSEYRDDLLTYLHGWLVKDFKSGKDRAYCMSLTLDDLLAELPGYAHRLIEEFPKLDVIVHKAVPMDGQVITVGTVRLKPENIVTLQVRHRPDIKVEV